MPLAAQYKLTAIVTADFTLLGIEDQDLAVGIEELMAGGAGNVDREFVAIAEQKPICSFTTTAIATALTSIGINGYPIAAEADLYFAKYANAGEIASGSVHLKVSCSLGLIVPKTLEASQGKSAARMACELYALSSDGHTNPLTITTGSALAAFGTVAEQFTLGPVELNSGSITGVQSVKWDFGIKCQPTGSDGEVYPTFVAVTDRYGIHCAVNGFDLAGLSTFGLGGTALTNFKTFFRKKAAAGVNIADATASHVKIAGTAGMLHPRGAKGQNGKPMDGDWNILPTYDGTNNVLQISTASAVT